MGSANYDENAEQSILGCMLIDSICIKKAIDHLSSHDFYREVHQNIFNLIKSMYEDERPVDIISITAEARDNGGIERCNSAVYISELLDSVPTTANLVSYINIVKDKSKKRKEEDLRNRLVNDIQSGHPLNELLPFYNKAYNVLHEDQKDPVWEASKFLKHDFQEPQAYCNGLIYPRGISIVVGQPKTYKTICILNLAFALAIGKPFLNFEVSSPAKTLVLQAELSDGRLQERMLNLVNHWGSPIEGKLYIRTIRGAFLNEKDGLSKVSSIIRQVDPEVVIIDPLVEFFSGDENKAQDISSLFANLDTLLTADRSIVLVHHFRKPSKDGGDNFNLIRGSSVIFGKVDAAISLSPLVDNQVIMDFACRNIAKPDKFIATIDENLVFHYLKPFGMAKVKESHIIDALGKEKMLMKELADKVSDQCECKPGTVKRHITEMINKGKLIKEGTTKNATVRLPD